MTTNVRDSVELNPTCVAHTGQLFKDLVTSNYGGGIVAEPNCFRQSRLSPDGTSIITYNADLRLRTFVLPPTLLSSERNIPQDLAAYSTSSPQTSNVFSVYPGFVLSDGASTLVLQARQDLPIGLVNALDYSRTQAAYHWVKPTTEAHQQPQSLEWTADGTQFVAGGRRRIAIFDASRTEGPVADHATWHSKDLQAEGAGLNDLVSALAISNDHVLAAGSTQRQLALYEANGTGQMVTQFSMRDIPDNSGTGVMQIEWDSSGRYLYVAERKSDEIAVFDIRGGRVLCQLVGRSAQSSMRQDFALHAHDEAVDLWAGGTDGHVRVWRDVLSKEGKVMPDGGFAAHEESVSGLLMHPCGSVLATMAGDRNSEHADVDDGGERVSLRVWSI